MHTARREKVQGRKTCAYCLADWTVTQSRRTEKCGKDLYSRQECEHLGNPRFPKPSSTGARSEPQSLIPSCSVPFGSHQTRFAHSVLPAGIEPTSQPPQGCILSVERREPSYAPITSELRRASSGKITTARPPKLIYNLSESGNDGSLRGNVAYP